MSGTGYIASGLPAGFDCLVGVDVEAVGLLVELIAACFAFPIGMPCALRSEPPL